MVHSKKNSLYKIIMLIIVTALISFLISSVIFYNYYLKTDQGNIKALSKYISISDSTTTLEQKIEILKKYLENEYFGELNEDKMIESALKGYVKGLDDKYTEYLTEKELEELMISVNGNYVGIGIYMTKDEDGNILVLLPIEGSPAEEANLQTGDIILKVNGIECSGMELEDVSDMVKGEEGTTVNLDILRNDEVINLDIERRRVELKYLKSDILEDNIGYIKMLSFDEGTSNKLKQQINDLKEKKVKCLIIDIRDNTGGLVTEAIAVSELFMPNGKTILKSYDKEGKETEIKSKAISTENVPIVILTNESSASAAEIFAAAMQDNKIATLIGAKTFGKGVMQEIRPLAIGGALKITIEEFKTPNGEKIHEIGITPDIEVKNDGEEDAQLQTAIDFLKER